MDFFIQNYIIQKLEIFIIKLSKNYSNFKKKVCIQSNTFMEQQSTTSLTKLKQFLQQISTQNDPYWQTILQSDIRNILPKHEVCKIQLVKNNLSKIRLIMQNLNTFISLQVQKKHLKDQMIDLNQNISKQLQQIINQAKNNQTSRQHHYDTTLNKRKKQLQIIAKQLSRSKTSQQLKLLIEKNHKWQQYLLKNIKQLQKVKEQDIHEDIINFIQTYQQLFASIGEQIQAKDPYAPSDAIYDEVILKSGSYTKMYQNKLKEKILINKLLDSVYSTTQDEENLSDQDNYWKQQVNNIRQLNDF